MTPVRFCSALMSVRGWALTGRGTHDVGACSSRPPAPPPRGELVLARKCTAEQWGLVPAPPKARHPSLTAGVL